MLEIGFGNGEVLAALAGAHPEFDYLGIEVHEPGIGHLLLLLEDQGIQNVRLLNGDAVELIRDRIPPVSLAAINIFFPDPWPKKRHHKRRLIQPDFVALLARCLEARGILHIATDWQPYVEHVVAVLKRSDRFTALSPEQRSGDAALMERRPTRFESRGKRLGHTVTDLFFQRA